MISTVSWNTLILSHITYCGKFWWSPQFSSLSLPAITAIPTKSTFSQYCHSLVSEEQVSALQNHSFFFFWFSDPLSTQSCHFLLVQLILLFILQTCMFTYLLISPLYYSNINLWLILHLFPKGGNFQRGLGKLMTPLLSRAVWVIGFIALAIKWNQAKCMCPYAYRSFG